MAPLARPRPAFLAGLAALAVAFAAWAGGPLSWPELVSLDLRFQARGTVNPGSQIVLVPISRRMFDLGTRTWPLQRDIYTHALENLRRAGARAVGLDVLMESASPDDAGLAAEIRRWHGRAVLSDRQATEGENRQGTVRIDIRAPLKGTARDRFQLPGNGSLAPYWPLGAGYVEVSQAQDGVVHDIVPRLRILNVVIDSFPLALARLLKPARESWYVPGRSVTMNYAGPAGTFPAAADLDLVAANLFDPRSVAGKVVLIGSTDPAQKDLFVGPYDHGAALTPGVELNANALWTLIGGREIRRVPAPLAALAESLIGIFALGIGLRLRPLPALIATLLALVAYGGLA